MDYFSAAEGLSRHTERVRVDVLAPSSVLATHVFQLFLLRQCDLLLLLLFFISDLFLLSFQVICLDREQIVCLMVSEKNANAFEAKELRQHLPAVHDEVVVAALGADHARRAYRRHHLLLDLLLKDGRLHLL